MPSEDTQFKPGVSGNPLGLRPGYRFKATLLAEKLMTSGLEEIIKIVRDAALNGDMTAAKIILDRACPPRRDKPVAFPLPKLERPADAVAAHAAVISAVASGDLTPCEAGEISRLIEAFVRTLEATQSRPLNRMAVGVTPAEPHSPDPDGQAEERSSEALNARIGLANGLLNAAFNRPR